MELVKNDLFFFQSLKSDAGVESAPKQWELEEWASEWDGRCCKSSLNVSVEKHRVHTWAHIDVAKQMGEAVLSISEEKTETQPINNKKTLQLQHLMHRKYLQSALKPNMSFPAWWNQNLVKNIHSLAFSQLVSTASLNQPHHSRWKYASNGFEKSPRRSVMWLMPGVLTLLRKAENFSWFVLQTHWWNSVKYVPHPNRAVTHELPSWPQKLLKCGCIAFHCMHPFSSLNQWASCVCAGRALLRPLSGHWWPPSYLWNDFQVLWTYELMLHAAFEGLPASSRLFQNERACSTHWWGLLWSL